MKRRVNITLDELTQVFEFSSDEMTHYLNIETGKVAMYSNLTGGFDEHGEEIKNANAFADHKYIEIWGIHPYEVFRDMENFVETLSDTLLKGKLKTILKGRSAFHHFKEELAKHPDEHQRWLVFKKECCLKRIYDWLEENDLEMEHD